MRALLMTMVFAGVSGAVCAQPAIDTMRDLESCFQSARESTAICSNPAIAPAQRLECFEKVRSDQLECMKHITAAAPAAASDVPTAAISSDTTAVERPPPDTADEKPAPPRQSAALPQDNAADARRPDLSAVDSTANAIAAPARQPQETDWIVSETTSPVDYAPLVTAAIRSTSGAATLTMKCREGNTELSVRAKQAWRASQGGGLQVALQVNDQAATKLPWVESPDGMTISLKDGATQLLRSLPEGGQLKISISDRPEALFQLNGLEAARSKIGAACRAMPAAGSAAEKKIISQGGPKQIVTAAQPVKAVHSSSPSPAVPSSAPRPTEQ